MTEEVPSPKLSPLHTFHLSRGAKMADFGGWLMPIEYPISSPTDSVAAQGGVIAEHHAVRERVGIFDVSHLGKISISGEGAVDFLNALLTNDLTAISDGQAQYSLLCDDAGGVIDDLIAYRISEREIFLIPNASNSQKVFEEIVSRAPNAISVVNRHLDYGVIAVQGPKSKELIEAIGISLPDSLDYMSFTKVSFQGSEIILCRTGYTGELGFEFVSLVESDLTKNLWSALVARLELFEGLVVGLGARDTLRTEMGYALHGHELSREITPLQAGVGWAVAWQKETFLGREALSKEKEVGLSKRSVALLAKDRTIPRAGMSVLSDGKEVGVVTSGTFSPSLKKGIALALITPGFPAGSPVTIDVRGRSGEFEVVKLPFVPSHVR